MVMMMGDIGLVPGFDNGGLYNLDWGFGMPWALGSEPLD
jgi:hypothetical protein